MDLSHLSRPFFDSSCIEFAAGFERWVRAELVGFEQEEGGDGKAARQIFERLAAAGCCEVPSRNRLSVIDARSVSAAYASCVK
jgi:hypothetical protein